MITWENLPIMLIMPIGGLLIGLGFVIYAKLEGRAERNSRR